MTLPINTIVNTDVLDYLRGLPDECAHCCVTSPPYWGLRDYGLAPSHWEAVEYAPMAGLAPVAVPAMDACLGLEPTPDAFVGHIVEVFREVRRVLRADGTLWLNFGDCYATGAGKVGDCPGGGGQGKRWKGCKGNRGGHEGKHTYLQGENGVGPMTQPNRMPQQGLKPKDLVGIPWRVAFALQADGWYLRSDVVWAKPNPMPESVTDRPTKAHEYVFLLSKSQRYFYDAEAVKEDVTGNAHGRGDGVNPKAKAFGPNSRVNVARCGNAPQVRTNKQSGHGRRRDGFNERWKCKQNESFSAAVNGLVSSRNLRSVWAIATAPFSEAHFATFPPELPKRCIMAGCPQGGIVLEPFCGAGTVPLVATALLRDWIACELNPEYVKMGANRVLSGIAAQTKREKKVEGQLLLEAGSA